MPQPTDYGALRDTHRQVEEQRNPQPPASRQPRNYEPLRDTGREVEERREASAEASRSSQERPVRPVLRVLRMWTQLGGMEHHNASAFRWIRQNYEIRMAQSNQSGPGRGGEGAQAENDPDLAEARAAVEEAQRREAAERARAQERDRGLER